MSYLFTSARRFLASLALVATLGGTALAVPARPGVTRVVSLSDGTEIRVLLRGDENFHFYVNAETGAAVREQADGTWAEDGRDLTSLWSAAAARRAASRQPLAERTRRLLAPRRVGEPTTSSGTKKGLLILVNFSDKAMNAKSTAAVFDQMLNGLANPYGKNYGSVREYFQAQSYGCFDISFDVVGPLTLSQSMSYYGGNDSSDNDLRPGQMIKEACRLADSQVDFRDYDWDGDGEVENIYVTYAGYGENYNGADPNTIWPHQWDLKSATGSTLKLDGVTINTYACGAELDGTSGTTISGIGTMCHEYSHCLGLPDFYDTEYSGHADMLDWSLMASGSYNGDGFHPAGYTAYERWFCGWLEPTELSQGCFVNGLRPIEDSPEAYVVYNEGHRDEYYLLANHQLRGWDQKAAGHGMMVLHVDYNKSAWSNNTVNNTAGHQRMIVLSARGSFYNENGTYYASGSDLFPGTLSRRALTSTSTPAAKLYNKNTDGTYFMGKDIEAIAESAGLISFTFMGGPQVDAPVLADASDVGPTAATLSWTASAQAATYNLELTASDSAGDGGQGGGAQDDEDELTAALTLMEQFPGLTAEKDGSKRITSLDGLTDEAGWLGDYVYVGKGGAKLGSGSGVGYLTSPLLAGTSDQLTVYVEAKSFGTDESKMKISVTDPTGDTDLQSQTVQLSGSAFVVHFSGVGSSYRVNFANTAKKKRFYLSYVITFDGDFTLDQVTAALAPRRGAPHHAPAEPSTLTGLTGLTHTLTGLAPSTTYTCRVQAVDASGVQSAWSNPVAFTTLPLPAGDINGDGSVTIADVTALVNLLLGKAGSAAPGAEADVNGDGEVTIADVTALVNLILKRQSTP